MLFCFVVLCLFCLNGGKIAATREIDMPSLKNTRLSTAFLAAAAMSPVGNFTVTNITEVQPVNTAQNITTNNAPEGLVPHNVSLNNAQLGESFEESVVLFQSEDERLAARRMRLDGEGESLEESVVMFQSEDERRLDGGRKVYERDSLEESVVLFQSEDERRLDGGRKAYERDSLEESVVLFQSEDERRLDGGRKLYEGDSLEEPVVLFQSEDERRLDGGRKLYEGDLLEEPVVFFQSEDEPVLQQHALPPMSLYTTPRYQCYSATMRSRSQTGTPM
ncbi:hypothetical protein ACLB2K_014472 [Fragaria x ananassa]